MFTVCFNVDTGRSEMDLSKKSQFILLDFAYAHSLKQKKN